MELIIKFLFLVIFTKGVVSTLCSCECPPDGYPLANLEDFPHHVTIKVKTSAGQERVCSGSIITDQWILSSIRCVYQGIDLEILFQRLHLNDPKGSFSMKVQNSSVHQFPDDNFDMALIQLPKKLNFTSTVKPITLHFEQGFFDYQKAVMPGFYRGGSSLSYGIYTVSHNRDCKKVYEILFDEYHQICARGFQNNTHVPCEGNEGGGLITGWPKEPRLVAVFNTPLNCLSEMPAVYFKVNKFIGWIVNLTGYKYP